MAIVRGATQWPSADPTRGKEGHSAHVGPGRVDGCGVRIAVMGLPPDYAYPGDTRVWWSDTTSQAANLGAAFITRSIMRQLGASYVSVDTPADQITESYDYIVLALATHIHRRRDVSMFATTVEAIDLPVAAFSLGIEDYVDESAVDDYVLDPTVQRLLRVVEDRTGVLGCRGPWSARVLEANGFRRVVPFGCPSLFWQLGRDIEVAECPVLPLHPLWAFHRTLVRLAGRVGDARVLGQDFQDHALMTSDLDSDVLLHEKNDRFLAEHPEPVASMFRRFARTRGTWPGGFDAWMSQIAAADFVVGPRLHACIAALTQGVPSLLLTRDLRTREMAHSTGLPSIPLETAGRLGLIDLAASVDLVSFRSRYSSSYDTYVGLLESLGLGSAFSEASLEHDHRLALSAHAALEAD